MCPSLCTSNQMKAISEKMILYIMQTQQHGSDFYDSDYNDSDFYDN